MNANSYTHQDFAAFVGIDWADQKHAFCLQAAGQSKTESGALEQKPETLAAWVTKLRERFGGRTVAVAIEQSRGALIHALLEYDFFVLFPIHPTTVARFREAFKFSGAKSDPLDTEQILAILTKHLDLLKPLNPDAEQTRLLARLVEDRRKTVELRTRHIQALQASLKEYFPQALAILSNNVTSRLACDFLKKWPDFPAFQQARPSTVKRFLSGHNVRSPQVIEAALQLAEKSSALTTDPAIVQSGARLSQMHAEAIQTFNRHIQEYDRRIDQLFHAHDDAKIFTGLPGAGAALAPRLLVAFGSDRLRYESAENVQRFSGVAPVTKTSGKMRAVYARVACPKFLRQTFHEFVRQSLPNCQWARNYVDYHTGRGKKYHTVIRALAFKWIRILFRCWKARTAYDDAKYMEALQKRGSIFATLHLSKPA